MVVYNNNNNMLIGIYAYYYYYHGVQDSCRLLSLYESYGAYICIVCVPIYIYVFNIYACGGEVRKETERYEGSMTVQ